MISYWPNPTSSYIFSTAPTTSHSRPLYEIQYHVWPLDEIAETISDFCTISDLGHSNQSISKHFGNTFHFLWHLNEFWGNIEITCDHAWWSLASIYDPVWLLRILYGSYPMFMQLNNNIFWLVCSLNVKIQNHACKK